MSEQIATKEIFRGHAAGPGRVAGAAFHWRGASVGLTVAIDAAMPPAERLERAFAAADDVMAARIAVADDTLRPLLEVQRLMLDDPELREGAAALAKAGTDPAQAVKTVAVQLALVLEGAGTEYFRDRAIDVRAVGKLLAEILTGSDATAVPRGAVVLAEELAPLDTSQLSEAGVAAMVAVCGGPTCHAAIIARAWGTPAVVGAPPEILRIPDGTPVLIDGDAGLIIINPTPEDLAEVAQSAPAITLARRIPIYANIGSAAEVTRALEADAEGIGLLRTEFFFQGRATAPSEDEQAAEYAEILQKMHGRPVIIRTLDIGADKPVAFLPERKEPNPQLGLRGVRLSLHERELFTTQLRALLRASTAGTLKIMLPMVTTAGEVREVRALLEDMAAELNVPVPPLGAMIEVPMAALAAEELAGACDFFSLGTNDLMQFLLAADRQHAGVGYLHAADHPAVWNLIGHVVTAAHAAGIPAGVCGEWGADPVKLAKLLDLGIDSASVAVGALGRVRAMLPIE
ncbi:MAG: phosphoenolpyruvate--protein phosphotransferase [Armatimonadota bacterium]